MGKYTQIVQSKNQPDQPESNESGNAENIKTSNAESNKSGKQQNQQTSKPENQKAVSSDMVNLSIKVPRRLRQKWVAESRLRGTTLTAIISDYLKIELGE